MAGERKTAPVGVIGLGFIGSALAERLLNAGYDVAGFDIEADKGAPLVRRGLRRAKSIEEIGETCRHIVLAVYDTDQVIDVLEGEGGLVQGAAGAELTVVVVTTCEPDAIATLAGRVANVGISLIEFPISGHSEQVRRGDGLGLVAGEERAVEAAADLLTVLCPNRFPIGRAGDAARAKLAIQLVSQLNRCALAEGLILASSFGLDLSAFLKVLAASPAQSAVMESKGEKMVTGDYSPQSRVAQTLRDAQLILEEGRRRGLRLPLMETNTALLAATIEIGGPDRDSSAIIEAIRAQK